MLGCDGYILQSILKFFFGPISLFLCTLIVVIIQCCSFVYWPFICSWVCLQQVHSVLRKNDTGTAPAPSTVRRASRPTCLCLSPVQASVVQRQIELQHRRKSNQLSDVVDCVCVDHEFVYFWTAPETASAWLLNEIAVGTTANYTLCGVFLRQRIAVNSFTFSQSMSWAVVMTCPMQSSASAIRDSLAALRGTNRFWALPVPTYTAVCRVGMDDRMSADSSLLLLAHSEGLVWPLTQTSWCDFAHGASSGEACCH